MMPTCYKSLFDGRKLRDKLRNLFMLPVFVAIFLVGASLSLAAPSQIPVPGMVTMIDLGADRCIPCKMMAPILAKAKKEYEGKAAIIFLDVWKDPTPARRFGIKLIPTQIFFDKDGNEVSRHQGFMDKKTIEATLKKLGVEK
jgi:thioredoxin 1